MRRARPILQRGFTLLELLVALTLSVLLLTVLSAALFQVGREWTGSSERLDRRLDLSLALLQLERALQGTLPHFYRDEERQALLFFEGDERSLSWVSTLSPGGGVGFRAWRLDGEVAEGEEGEGAWLRLAPALTDSPEERLEEAPGRLLVPGYRPRFAYLEVDPAKPEEREWVEEWSAEERRVLPQAVRVVLEPLEQESESLEVVAAIAAFQHNNVRPKVTKK